MRGLRRQASAATTDGSTGLNVQPGSQWPGQQSHFAGDDAKAWAPTTAGLGLIVRRQGLHSAKVEVQLPTGRIVENQIVAALGLIFQKEMRLRRWCPRRPSGIDERPRQLTPTIYPGKILGSSNIVRVNLLLYKERAPGHSPGALSRAAGAAYRLTWRLAPPPGPLPGPLPRTSPVETSLTQSEPLPL